MPSRFEEVYRFDRKTPLTDDELNRRFKDVDDRLAKGEAVRLNEDTAFALLMDRILGRAEQVVANLRATVQAIVEIDWVNLINGRVDAVEAALPAKATVASLNVAQATLNARIDDVEDDVALKANQVDLTATANALDVRLDVVEAAQQFAVLQANQWFYR